MSAQSCGCDEEAKWVCRLHQYFPPLADWGGSIPLQPGTVVPVPENMTAFEFGKKLSAVLEGLSATERKAVPIATGCLDYFPDAIAAVAHVSKVGNDQHNPGQPLHWDRAKSTDEADALMRHFMERGKLDTDGLRHSAKAAWRALALLQKEIEASR